ncbi:MAG TPA: Stp1/IreP family PP2C-type Ser/Thr phosphatase [Candidatus Krumholzibacteria bacterium]|nr:Stp1/IreP family PP2C-type Ser/Thr phosphatase [Candidatus Krumholzibacteria bacterium]
MRAAGRTDIGRHRASNEDSILLIPDRGLFAVADGMGGHRGGRVASHMVTAELGEIARASETPLDGPALEQALVQINRHVFERGESDADLQRMGSTCVAVSIDGRLAQVAHIGDSRCYLVRENRTWQVTSDHRAIQTMIDQGALTESESRVHPMRNVLTRSVGVEPAVEVSRNELELQSGDRMVLCSDGLTDMLTEAEIAAEVSASSDLDQLVESLVAQANQAGGSDNISVVVVEIDDGVGE